LVSDASDVIFGAGGWQRPRLGAQILFSLPEPGPWVLPDGWHMDCGFEQATWPVRSVKLFAFLGEVGPRGAARCCCPARVGWLTATGKACRRQPADRTAGRGGHPPARLPRPLAQYWCCYAADARARRSAGPARP